MSEARVVGTCGSCQRSFHVPARGKAYRCRSCGGVVSAPRSTPGVARVEGQGPAPSIACPTCGAASPDSARYCDACGEPLVTGARTHRASRGSQARAAAGGELKRARRSIGLVRGLFLANAAFTGAALLYWYRNLLEATVYQVSTGLWGLLGILTVQLAIAVVAVVRVRHEPFLWATALASFATLSFVLRRLDEVERDLISIGFGALWPVLLWGLVARTARVRRILAEHPDLYGAQSLQGTLDEARVLKRRKGGLDAEDVRRLAASARRRVGRQTAVALLAVFGISGGLAYALRSKTVDSPESVLAEFVAEWNARDAEALERRFAPRDNGAADAWRRLRAGPLAARLPPLGEPEREAFRTREGEAAWDTDHGPVVVRVRHQDGAWTIAEFVPPTPPIGDGPEAFRAAWNGNSVRGVAALYRESSREEMVAVLGRTASVRGWVDEAGDVSLPKLGAPVLLQSGDQRREYMLTGAGGSFEVTFRIVDGGGWAVTSLKLPERGRDPQGG